MGFGAGNAVANPTQHRLWKKYVTFHQVRAENTAHDSKRACSAGIPQAIQPHARAPFAWCWFIHFLLHLQGLSINETIVAAIKTAAQGAKTVMALLDSDHWAGNVANELATYCNTLVTVNSYCIVEVRGASPGALCEEGSSLGTEEAQQAVCGSRGRAPLQCIAVLTRPAR